MCVFYSWFSYKLKMSSFGYYRDETQDYPQERNQSTISIESQALVTHAESPEDIRTYKKNVKDGFTTGDVVAFNIETYNPSDTYLKVWRTTSNLPIQSSTQRGTKWGIAGIAAQGSTLDVNSAEVLEIYTGGLVAVRISDVNLKALRSDFKFGAPIHVRFPTEKEAERSSSIRLCHPPPNIKINFTADAKSMLTLREYTIVQTNWKNSQVTYAVSGLGRGVKKDFNLAGVPYATYKDGKVANTKGDGTMSDFLRTSDIQKFRAKVTEIATTSVFADEQTYLDDFARRLWKEIGEPILKEHTYKQIFELSNLPHNSKNSDLLVRFKEHLLNIAVVISYFYSGFVTVTATEIAGVNTEHFFGDPHDLYKLLINSISDYMNNYIENLVKSQFPKLGTVRTPRSNKTNGCIMVQLG